MSFYICHCGNDSTNHYFKHPYIQTTLVKYSDKEERTFRLNASDFPLKTKTKCSKPNCNLDNELHGTEIIEHKFEPIEYSYREINLSIPDKTICNYSKCHEELQNHSKIMTHHFTTKVVIDNLKEEDVVNIINFEDEDVKIIWK